ncbi:MAG: GlsB/YeaQ/YmgE family stress response membrane protein [Actinomycetota bacterium]
MVRSVPTTPGRLLAVGLLEWIVVGTIVGLLARLMLRSSHPVGCLGTIFIGIAGAAIGEKVWEEIFGKQRGVAWIGSVLAAMLLLAIFSRLLPR